LKSQSLILLAVFFGVATALGCHISTGPGGSWEKGPESETYGAVAEAGADPDAGADPEAGTGPEVGTEPDAGQELLLTSPSDGATFAFGAPVRFEGTTSGDLEVIVDDELTIGSTDDEGGDFTFIHAFTEPGEHLVELHLDGTVELAVNITVGEPYARVCLSPGHPSQEDDKLYEAIINRKVAYDLEDMLNAAGYDVYIIVDDISENEIFAPGFDNEGAAEQSMLEVIDLDDRSIACNDWQADYFISIHHNAWSRQASNYALTLYGEDPDYMPRFPDAVEWAEVTASYLFDAMGVTHDYTWGDRSNIGIAFRVLKDTNMIGIMTEGSFYSNPAERSRLNENDYLFGEADAIYQGFIDFVEG